VLTLAKTEGDPVCWQSTTQDATPTRTVRPFNSAVSGPKKIKKKQQGPML